METAARWGERFCQISNLCLLCYQHFHHQKSTTLSLSIVQLLSSYNRTIQVSRFEVSSFDLSHSQQVETNAFITVKALRYPTYSYRSENEIFNQHKFWLKEAQFLASFILGSFSAFLFKNLFFLFVRLRLCTCLNFFLRNFF